MSPAEPSARLVRGCALASMFLGVAGVLSNELRSPWLEGALPRLLGMSLNTGLAFALAGGSLLAGSAQGRVRSIAAALGLTAAVIGALTLVEYAAGSDLGIDRLLLFASPGENPAAFPPRMAASTALALTLLGCALGALRAPRLQGLAQPFIVLAFTIAFIAGCGHALDVTALYGVAGLSAMSLSTVLGLAVLACGTLAARLDRGVGSAFVRRGSASAGARLSLPVLLVTPLFMGWLAMLGKRAGWYGTEFAFALAITACTSLLVSFGLWHAHEQQRVERSRAELLADDAFLTELSELFRGASEAADLLVEVARGVARHLEVSRAFFNEIDEAAQVGIVHQPRGSGLPTRVLPLADIAPDHLRDLRAGRTIVDVDTREDSRTSAQYRDLHAPKGVRALVAVPLQREGRWAMTLLVSHSEPRAWRARDISLIESVAERTWLWAEHLRHIQAIRQREEDLEVTIQSIGEGIITTDRDGRVAHMNRVAEKLTGWGSSEARGHALAEIYRVDTDVDIAPAPSAIERALHQGAALYLISDTTLIDRDGQQCPITESAAPIIGPDGATRGVVLAFRDERVRRASEGALRSSEAKYRKLYESLPDMCATVDLDREVIVDCNETMAERLGYGKGEVVGQLMTSLYDPGHLGFADQARSAMQRDGDLRDQERVLRHKDGSLLEVSVSAVRFEDADGHAYAISVWRDVSTRNQAERDRRLLAELGESARIASDATQLMNQWAARLLDYLEVDRVGFAEVDLEHDVLHIRAELSHGLPRMPATLSLSAFGAEAGAEHQAGQTTVLCDTASDPRTRALFESAYRPAGIGACVAVPVRRDQRWVASLTITQRAPRRWTEREVTLLQQTAERAWLWIEHFRLSAVLREREAAALVQASERRFRLLVDAVKDYAIFLLDPEGNVSTWNEGARRLKGYEAGEVLGKNFALFYTEADRARQHAADVLERAARDGSYGEEGWRVRKDGSKFWADVLVTALRDASGKLEGFAKVTRDHTERRRTEQILRDREVALVAGLREREILLQEVHHRVKNNLQLISSLINFQCRELEPGTARDALDACRERVLSIALIHERLYRSQDYANMSFADYARNLTSSIYHATGVPPARVGLELQLEDISFSVEKAVPCGLILNELMTNALKHAFPGDRTGALSVALRRVPGPLIELAVGDDGIGMAQDVAVTPRGSLGLQLVGMLVEQLEGKLDVIQEHGTTFRVTFPAESRQ